MRHLNRVAVIAAITSHLLVEAQPLRDQAADHLTARAMKAVILLTMKGKTSDGDPASDMGSGFLITPDGYALTNQHVAAPDSIEVTSRIATVGGRSGKEYAFDVIQVDSTHDLALIKLKSASNLDYVPLKTRQDVMVGESVQIMGFPPHQQLGLQIIPGLISDLAAPQGLWQLTAEPYPGNSGGPVLNVERRVVAILRARVTGVNNIALAIPVSDAVNGLLAKAKIPFSTDWRYTPKILSSNISKNFELNAKNAAVYDKLDAYHTYTSEFDSEAGYEFDNVWIEKDELESQKSEASYTIAPDKTRVAVLMKVRGNYLGFSSAGVFKGILKTTQVRR